VENFIRRLDFDRLRTQKLHKVFSSSENFYAIWRPQFAANSILRDRRDLPSERLFQIVWQHQRLQRDRLKTADEKACAFFIRDSSAWKAARILATPLQIGNDLPRSGDVEIDLRPAGWRAHGHDQNKDFQNVILHVVWESDKTANARSETNVNRPPTLALHDFLDAPMAELSLALENEPLRSLPENLRGKCSAPLHELPESQLTELLHAAAQVRFEIRPRRCWRALKIPTGNRRCGKICFAPWATTTMPGRCKTSRKQNRAGKTEWIPHSKFKRVAGSRWPAAGGIDAGAEKFRYFYAAGVGCLVARP
jgi:hypothetical protein